MENRTRKIAWRLSRLLDSDVRDDAIRPTYKIKTRGEYRAFDLVRDVRCVARAYLKLQPKAKDKKR